MHIAPTAFAALGQQCDLAVLGQVGDDFTGLSLSMIRVPTGMRSMMSSAPLP